MMDFDLNLTGQSDSLGTVSPVKLNLIKVHEDIMEYFRNQVDSGIAIDEDNIAFDHWMNENNEGYGFKTRLPKHAYDSQYDYVYRFYIRDLAVVVTVIEILIGRLYADFSSFRGALEKLLSLCSKVF